MTTLWCRILEVRLPPSKTSLVHIGVVSFFSVIKSNLMSYFRIFISRKTWKFSNFKLKKKSWNHKAAGTKIQLRMKEKKRKILPQCVICNWCIPSLAFPTCPSNCISFFFVFVRRPSSWCCCRDSCGCVLYWLWLDHVSYSGICSDNIRNVVCKYWDLINYQIN